MGGFYDDKKFHQISFLPLNIGFSKIRDPVRNKISGKCSGTGIPHKPGRDLPRPAAIYQAGSKNEPSRDLPRPHIYQSSNGKP